ncbi:hypothetical protein PHISCL_10648 [Aspergillus sclerotialis]|uniref:Uncharacterized protein n=1 Tax=Aspergillus sclerotialis TaxID=2070753 RepID=A0A3A2ZGG7_9EURO|nr:hypothetical protein PHISCL_10648 [Aspergillus sclerotialis]
MRVHGIRKHLKPLVHGRRLLLLFAAGLPLLVGRLLDRRPTGGPRDDCLDDGLLFFPFATPFKLSALASEKSLLESDSLGEVLPAVYENMREMRFAMVGLAVFAGGGGMGSTSLFAADRSMPARARVM